MSTWFRGRSRRRACLPLSRPFRPMSVTSSSANRFGLLTGCQRARYGRIPVSGDTFGTENPPVYFEAWPEPPRDLTVQVLLGGGCHLDDLLSGAIDFVAWGHEANDAKAQQDF